MEEDISCKSQPKNVGVPILLSEKLKIDFMSKSVSRDKEGHYIIVKESTQQEDVAIFNICGSNIGTPV